MNGDGCSSEPPVFSSTEFGIGTKHWLYSFANFEFVREPVRTLAGFFVPFLISEFYQNNSSEINKVFLSHSSCFGMQIGQPWATNRLVFEAARARLPASGVIARLRPWLALHSICLAVCPSYRSTPGPRAGPTPEGKSPYTEFRFRPGRRGAIGRGSHRG